MISKSAVRLDLLKVKSAFPEEMAFIEQTVSFLDHNPDCFNRDLEIGHIVSSAFVIDPVARKILLTHHKKLGRWLQLGGHLEQSDESIVAAAKREVMEESGLDCAILEDIFDVDVHLIPLRADFPAHMHYDVRYLCEHDSQKTIAASNESNFLEWHKIDHFKELVGGGLAASRVSAKLQAHFSER
jgi:8-oxo-dGTP pyrophosphatase MutT (NUDIX family)